MNPHTGELRAFIRGETLPEDFERVPDPLQKIAALKLRLAAMDAFAAAAMSTPGPSAHVNLRSGSPLAVWAKKKRKAKIAAASRRRNRK